MAQAYQYEKPGNMQIHCDNGNITLPWVKPLAGVLLEKGNNYNYIFNKMSCSDMEREWRRKAKI